MKWTTKKYDLMLAQKLIDSYVDIYEQDKLELLEYVSEGSITVTSNISDWTIDLENIYIEHYGEELGLEVSKKVLSTCLLGDFTQH